MLKNRVHASVHFVPTEGVELPSGFNSRAACRLVAMALLGAGIRKGSFTLSPHGKKMDNGSVSTSGIRWSDKLPEGIRLIIQPQSGLDRISAILSPAGDGGMKLRELKKLLDVVYDLHRTYSEMELHRFAHPQPSKKVVQPTMQIRTKKPVKKVKEVKIIAGPTRAKIHSKLKKEFRVEFKETRITLGATKLLLEELMSRFDIMTSLFQDNAKP